jgi:hypothetical protein
MKVFLYIKQHRVTKLKYFGKTASKDPYKYRGSGKYWLRHLKAHGIDIDTVQVWEFNDIDECEKFALNFSKENNIVESAEWANLVPENGKDGGHGHGGLKGKDNPNWGKTKEKNSFYGKKHTPENIAFFKSIPKYQTGSANKQARKVRTPKGEFGCMKDAALAEGFTTETLRQRIKHKAIGYEYID